MNKTKSIVSGKKAYVSPVSYCLTVSGNNICALSTPHTATDHSQVEFGGELDGQEVPVITQP